ALDQLIETHGTDWETVFERFTAERKRNGDAIAQMALENYIEMRDAVRDPLFHLRKQVEFELEHCFPGRFIPRYSIVMFHAEISYAEALARGEAQRQVLRALTEDRQDIDSVHFSQAASLLE